MVGVVNDVSSPYCRTRSVLRNIPAGAIQSAPGKDLVSLLQELNRTHDLRPVLIPCSDDFVWWLNDSRESVEQHADFLIPSSDMLELIADKSNFYRYAMKHNLPLPPTRFVTTRAEMEQAANELGFPILIKPPRKTPEWMQASGELKALKVEIFDDLCKIDWKLLTGTTELIVQKWISGPDANMHSLYVCLDRDSQPQTTSIVAKKLRQWPPDVGVGALAVEVAIDEVVQMGLGILRQLGYVGPGSIQFKQDSISNKFYVIEINSRLPLNYPLFEACGIEATYTAYCVAAGLPLPDNRTITRRGGKWICWKTDLASSYVHWRRGDLTVREWLTSLRGHKWSADIQLDDRNPLLAEISRKISKGLSKRSRMIIGKEG